MRKRELEKLVIEIWKSFWTIAVIVILFFIFVFTFLSVGTQSPESETYLTFTNFVIPNFLVILCVIYHTVEIWREYRLQNKVGVAL